MGTWILIAIFATIAVTAGLVAVLQRVNGQRPRRDKNLGDGGAIYADGASSRRDTDSHDSNGGSDSGGDGGGGGD
jgi:hypothetical protein